MLRWCEGHHVIYSVGIAQNNRLNTASYEMQQLAKDNYNKAKEKQKMFSEINYAAKKWKNERRVIVKAGLAYDLELPLLTYKLVKHLG